MTIREQIDAIIADDTLTLAEKRRAIRALRNGAFEQLLGDDLERTFTLASGVSVTISDPVARLVNGEPVLAFHLRVLRRNGRVHFEDDVVIVNPPVFVDDVDATGNPTVREDVRAALRQIITQIVK